MLTNHIGSYVYFASLITAMSRSLINKYINISRINGGKVFYCDTDSIILDQKGFSNLQDKIKISSSEFGCMKNEYPLNGD